MPVALICMRVRVQADTRIVNIPDSIQYMQYQHGEAVERRDPSSPSHNTRSCMHQVSLDYFFFTGGGLDRRSIRA